MKLHNETSLFGIQLDFAQFCEKKLLRKACDDQQGGGQIREASTRTHRKLFVVPLLLIAQLKHHRRARMYQRTGENLSNLEVIVKVCIGLSPSTDVVIVLSSSILTNRLYLINTTQSDSR